MQKFLQRGGELGYFGALEDNVKKNSLVILRGGGGERLTQGGGGEIDTRWGERLTQGGQTPPTPLKCTPE